MGESGGWRITHAPSCATRASAREGQLPDKDTRLTVRGSSVVGILASSG